MTQNGLLGYALEETQRAGDLENTRRLYNQIMKEFASAPEFIAFIKNRVHLGKKIAKGNRAPEFSFASLDQAGQTISPSFLKGKTYLIDLWATWCTPCVAEMKNLHHVYDKFKDKGFTIVSFSLDNSTENVATFRQKRWNMPWHNVLVAREERRMVQELFEHQGIPRAILVKADGTIVAIDEEIKGEKLEKMLAQLLPGGQ